MCMRKLEKYGVGTLHDYGGHDDSCIPVMGHWFWVDAVNVGVFARHTSCRLFLL